MDISNIIYDNDSYIINYDNDSYNINYDNYSYNINNDYDGYNIIISFFLTSRDISMHGMAPDRGISQKNSVSSIMSLY